MAFRQTHEHSLSLRNAELLIGQGIKCELCMKSVVAPFYGCDSCEYYVHKSCGDLPLQFTHSFHPSHPLRLYTNCYFYCDSCFKEFKDSPSYSCEECDFQMDVECALMPTETPSKEGQRCTKHLSHPHPLLFVETCDEECFPCKSKVSGEAAYGCAHCGYWLHQSCADFPSQSLSQHPLHPHPLSPNTRYDYTYITCGICETTSYRRHNFDFKCDQCDFWVCWKCNISVRRSFKSDEFHDHALCFVENYGNDSLHLCYSYYAYCTQSRFFNSQEFKRTKGSIFKCMDCNFKLHLLCGPLPSTVKHECHIHSLTLLDSLLDHDSGEYYCDVCEEERDPRIRVYHCEECKYSAHVHCVISEIVKVLTRGDVELRGLGNDTWSRAAEEQQGYISTSLTLNDLLLRMTEDEREKVGSYYRWDSTLAEAGQPLEEKEECITDEEIDKTLRLSRFTEDEFTTFKYDGIRYLRHVKWELESSELGMKLWEVRGYMIPRYLADVLQTLLKEYGDIASDVQWSLEMKSFALFILCRVVKRMHATMVDDITRHLLHVWFLHLRFVKHWGFKIGFACAQWERLVDAFLGLQAQRLEHEIPAILKAKMGEIQQGLDKCEEYRGSSEKSEYMNYCLRKASEWRRKIASDCFTRYCSDGTLSIPRKPLDWWS